MGIAERKQAEAEALKEKILTAAADIMKNKGYENLSIRKIANKIEYSPGIIYHYFKDKADILSCIVEIGYKKILKQISSVPINEENPSETLVEALKRYIDFMLQNPQLFKIILMSDIDSIQHKINILEQGISSKRETIGGLSKLISIAITKGNFREMDPELTAQIIWTSTHGLISRLIIEKEVSEHQKNRLIQHHFDVLLRGLTKTTTI
ncbi:TetR/AcrR family transcriptional regulator [Clostridium oryzae]|uniref:A-factor receptor protein n=1 Tax=Clostridium oryzae TaxID=1450648 RepID=A0A1V4IES5_9CLOT|nr:TetR/AcrR family transcriptional regulator [Clostridium oryzae]OPJ58502.1 A-factor receptor protein [Clostridium oryzae]